MTIKVDHAPAPKLVAVREAYNNGVWFPARDGVTLIENNGEVARTTNGLTLKQILVNRSGRTPVYEGSDILWSSNLGFRVDHASAPKLIAVLGEANLGIFMPTESGATIYINDTGVVETLHEDMALQDILEEYEGRTPVYEGSTITFGS